MLQIRARIRVGIDHSISGIAPADIPPGEHEVTIVLSEPGPDRVPLDDLPSHDLGPWPEGLRLRREDIYGEDGR